MAYFKIASTTDWITYLKNGTSSSADDVYEITAGVLNFRGIDCSVTREIKGKLYSSNPAGTIIFGIDKIGCLFTLFNGEMYGISYDSCTADKTLANPQNGFIRLGATANVHHLKFNKFKDMNGSGTYKGGIFYAYTGSPKLNNIEIYTYSNTFSGGTATNTTANTVGCLLGGRCDAKPEIFNINFRSVTLEGYQYTGLICGYMYYTIAFNNICIANCNVISNRDLGLCFGRTSFGIDCQNLIIYGTKAKTTYSATRLAAVSAFASTSAISAIRNNIIDFSWDRGTTTATGQLFLDSTSTTNWPVLTVSDIALTTTTANLPYKAGSTQHTNYYSWTTSNFASQARIESYAFKFPPWMIYSSFPVLNILLIPPASMNINIFQGGKWVKAKEMYVYQSGAWKKVKELNVFSGGGWKK